MVHRSGWKALLVGWGALFVGGGALSVECRRPYARASGPTQGKGARAAPIAARSEGSSLGDADAAAATTRHAPSSGERSIIAGIVLGPDGEPAVGVEITALPIGVEVADLPSPGGGNPDGDEVTDDKETATSDENGVFSLAVPPGDYSLTGTVDGDDRQLATEVLDPISLGPGERVDGLELHLQAALTVTGQIELTNEDEEREGIAICVRVHPRDPGCVATAESDAEGRFEFANLPAHPLFVRAGTDERQVIAQVRPPATLVLHLPPRPLCSGIVRAAEGTPVSDVEVIVRHANGCSLSSVTTDAEGHFSVLLDHPGMITVSARDDRGATQILRVDTAHAQGLALLLRAGALLTGRVTDRAGAAVTGESVVISHDGARIDSIEIDEEGGYALAHVPAGRIRVTLAREASQKDAPSVEVTVGGESEAHAPDLLVARGHTIRGRVIRLVDGERRAVAGAEIDVMSTEIGFHISESESTGPDGTFALPERFSRQVVLRAWADGQVGERVAVPITPGRDEEFVELIVSPERRVTGIVRGPDARPRARVKVLCGSSERTTTAAGRFDIGCPASAPGLEIDDGHTTRAIPVTWKPGGEVFVEVRL
ncbi:MAG: carboxypeptidase regulatory-like domain-containing protein [Myxococcales bacterium]|nr:carboxypeptidase regulatory-like domain-containing protein [Myxococcales bacterium]